MSIESSIIQVLQEVAPATTFILPYRNGVEPPAVYCLVMVLSKENIGRNEESLYNNTGKQIISQNMMCNARIQYFGDSKSTAQADAELMAMMLDTHIVRSKLYQRGLAVATIDGIKQAGVSRDTKMYMTHSMDISFLYKQTIEVDIPTIDSVDNEGTLSITGGDDLLIQFETEL
jgi:hypothetical protein